MIYIVWGGIKPSPKGDENDDEIHCPEMRVNRWELNRGYRGKSSGRNDLRLIESSVLTIFARPRHFPNCRKLMLGKALDFNGFRNYCGFRGSGPPASPRSTACSCLLFSNGMTTRNHSSDRPRWIRFREKLSRCRQTLEQIQPGCTLPRRRNRKQCPVNSWTPH